MSLILFLTLVATFIPFSFGQKPPNIILLLTDDQDVVLGGMDEMPKLKKLIQEEGTTFQNGFVHTPICCPSRSSILSGRYLHNKGALNNSIDGNCYGKEWIEQTELRTFATHAKKYGYKTSYAGKYLNQYGFGNDNTVPPGWDRWFGLVGNSVYYNYNIVESNDSGKTTTRTHHGKSYEDDYLPDLLANRTLEIMEDFASQDAPFLLVNAWPSCHAPFTPAPWAEHIYDGAKAPHTPNWNASEETTETKHWFIRQMGPIDDEMESWIDKNYQHRLETLLSVDSHIELFVKKLASHGILDNTVIIYTSDNGFQLGQHRVKNDKRLNYEHDIRVPFVARGPGFHRNVTSEKIVMNIDIAPTFVDIMSGHKDDTPKDMDGHSFVSSDDRTDFLVTYHGEGFPPCNLWTCPPPKTWNDGDAKNNTFHCLRTLEEGGENSIYCQFLDDENFREYFDMTVDEWQLENRYGELSDEARFKYESRLAQLKKCHGDSCRQVHKDFLRTINQ